jgi:arsenate reductase
MAEAIFNQIAKIQNLDIQARSAGTSPSKSLNKNVLKALSEIDLDTSYLEPKELTCSMLSESDTVITMGCEIALDQRPSLPVTTTIDWQLPDPSEVDLDETRKIRETIKEMVVELIQQHVES